LRNTSFFNTQKVCEKGEALLQSNWPALQGAQRINEAHARPKAILTRLILGSMAHYSFTNSLKTHKKETNKLMNRGINK